MAAKHTPWPGTFANAQHFLDALARESRGLLAYMDAEERIMFGTAALAEWFGHTPESLRGKTLRELHGEEGYRLFEPWLRRVLAGEAVQYERAARHVDGRTIWISVSLAPHRDESGRVVGFFSSSLEVNELKRTHDALGRALEEIASHMENTPLAVVEFDSNLCVKRWSPQAEDIFGWRFDEVRGRLPTDFGLVHADSLDMVLSLTQELASGHVRRNRMLVRNQTKDGRAIWCEWWNSVFLDDSGRLASILALAQDVTARVETEEQLQQAAVHDALTGLPNRNSLAARSSTRSCA
nr:two-component hybrid sensor and regulator [uncultured bacterium]